MLLTDGAGKFTGRNTEFVKHAMRISMQPQNSEQGGQNHNHTSEHEIGLLAKCWRRRIINKVITKRLWDFGLVYEAELLSIISRGKENGLDMKMLQVKRRR